MRNPLRTALPFVLLLSAPASAIEIEAGGRTLEIPLPSGYSELTPEMSPSYEAMYAYVVPTNERYLILVPDEAAAAFLRGKDADYDRYMMVEAERQTVQFDLTQAEFDELRDTMRGQIDELYDSVRESLPEVFDDASETISDRFDTDLAMSVGDIVPLEAHLDTDNAFAFSQLIKIGIAVDGEDQEPEVGIATATFVYVRDKLIFVYVYGGEDDLEWTREFANTWVDQILAANGEQTTQSTPNPTRGGILRPIDDPEALGDLPGSALNWPLIIVFAIAVGGRRIPPRVGFGSEDCVVCSPFAARI